MSTMYRNSESINLLTGAPSQRSLRLWLNYASETNRKANLAKGRSSAPSVLNFSEKEFVDTTKPNISPSKSPSRARLDSTLTKSSGVSIELFNAHSGQKSSFKSAYRNVTEVYVTRQGQLFGRTVEGRLISLEKADFDTVSTDSSQKSHERSSKDEFRANASALVKNVIELEPKQGLSNEDWFWSVPRFKPLLPIEQVSCGDSHICCYTDVTTGRLLYSWGSNNEGQCGYPNTKQTKLLEKPVLVPGIFNVCALECGPDYTVAMTNDYENFTLYSFGGGTPQNRLSALFKGHGLLTNSSGSVPHAEAIGLHAVQHQQHPQPLILFQPGRSDSGNGRPFRYWNDSLSNWVASVDAKWIMQTSRQTISVEGEEGVNHISNSENYEFMVEMANAQSRLGQMRRELSRDVNMEELSLPEWARTDDNVEDAAYFQDPASFEIEKILTQLDFEARTNVTQQEEFSDLKDEMESLKADQIRIETEKQVYNRVKEIFDTSLNRSRQTSSDRDVLFSLLEDCRKSDLHLVVQLHQNSASYKQRQQYQGSAFMSLRYGTSPSMWGMNSQAAQEGRDISLLQLIEESRDMLRNVKRGLDAFHSPPELVSVYQQVVRLYEKKMNQLMQIEQRLTDILKERDVELQRLQQVVLENADKFDLSHLIATSNSSAFSLV